MTQPSPKSLPTDARAPKVALLPDALFFTRAIPVAAETIARPGPLPFRPAEIAGYVAEGAPTWTTTFR